jgi:ribosomal protein S18 acetylase RimI-like enzyme
MAGHAAWRDALGRARRGELAFLDHPWPGTTRDGRRPGRILKLLCADEERLRRWAAARGLPAEVHRAGGLPHLDFLGERRAALLREGWPVARVRPAARDDAAALADLAGAGACPAPDGADLVLVAEDPEGRPLGFVAYRGRGSRRRLAGLYVVPAARGRGVGRLLLARGPAGPLWAEVAAADAAARAFLEGQGFHVVGRGRRGPSLRLRRSG